MVIEEDTRVSPLRPIRITVAESFDPASPDAQDFFWLCFDTVFWVVERNEAVAELSSSTDRVDAYYLGGRNTLSM